MQNRQGDNFFRLVIPLAGLACGICAFLAWMAARLQIDYFDTFETLLNAKAIVTLGHAPYAYHRFIVASLLQVPAVWLSHFFGGNGVLPLAHLISFGCGLLFLYLMFHFFRRSLSLCESLLALSLFVMTPLVIHYLPMAKEDLVASLFMTAAFYFYLEAEEHGERDLFFCGLLLGLSMGIRYNLIPSLFLIPFAYELIRRRKLPSLLEIKRKGLFLFLLPITVFLGFSAIVYPLIGAAPLSRAIAQFIDELFAQYRYNAIFGKPPLVNYLFLLRAMTLPGLAIALVGVWAAISQKRKDAVFFVVWFTVFFVFQTYFVPGKEARYLFPLFPPFFYFLSTGVLTLWDGVVHWGKWRAIFFVFLLAFFAVRGLAECAKFLDPFYTSPFEKRVSVEAASLAGSHDLFWLGRFYGLHPKEYVFEPNDDFAYLYHFFSQHVSFFTGRSVMSVMGGRWIARESWEKGVWLPQIGARVKNGDVLIVNLEPGSSVTKTVMKELPPLLIQRVRMQPLNTAADGEYELYQEKEGQPPSSLGIVQIKNHEVLGLSSVKTDSKSFLLLDFDRVEVFNPTRV